MNEAELSTVTKAQVRKAIEEKVVNGNGHDIFDEKIYTELGFDCEHLCQEHTSGESHKETIFDDHGNVLTRVRGIYSLDFHRWLAEQCGLVCGEDYPPQMGRGSEARVISDALKTWANSPDEGDKDE